MSLLNKIPFFSRKESQNEIFVDTVGEHNKYLLSALAPDYIEEGDNYVRLGSNFTRTLIVEDYSTVLSQEDIQELGEIKENVSIAVRFEKVSSGTIKNNLSKAIKENRKKMYDDRLDHGSKIDSELQISSATNVIRDLSSGNEVMYIGHLLIHINAPSKDELDKLTQHVKSITGSIGTAKSPSKRAFDAFESFLPLGKNKVSELSSRLMNSEAVSYFFPFHENELFEEKGVFVGVNTKTQNAILVDDSKLLNKHKFMIGISGVGKSTALFSDMMKKWQQGDRISVNDPKGEFGKIFKDLGGEWVKFSMNGQSVLNMFDLPKKAHNIQDEDYSSGSSPLLEKIPSLIVSFKLMYPLMTDIEKNIILGFILETYEHKNINENCDFSKLTYTDYPILSDFNEILLKAKAEKPELYKHIERFHLAIDVYITGIYKHLFNNYTNVDIYNDLVSYDTLEFQKNEDIQRIIYYNIMSHLINSVINGDGESAQFFFDECHVIADPKIPLAMQHLYFMLKVLRSFNVGVTTATQSIKDFLSAKDDKRNYGEAVIDQSIQKLYLPMKDTEISFLQKELAHVFSEKEISILTVREGNREEQAGKGILFVGSKKIECTVELTSMEKQLWFEKKKLDEIRI